MEPESREKTAFVTNSGLYEFRVMLMNVPAVFQRLMQQVLSGLNGPDFVAVRLDDVLLSSETFQSPSTPGSELNFRGRIEVEATSYDNTLAMLSHPRDDPLT